MKRWEQVLFGVSSLAILLIIGFKLHELDMPTARFVRSFNIGIVNQIGDLMAVAGKGAVLTVLFVLVALVGWWLKHDRLKEIGVRGVLALLWVTLAVQLLKHLIGRPRPRFAHADQFVLGPSLGEGLDLDSRASPSDCRSRACLSRHADTDRSHPSAPPGVGVARYRQYNPTPGSHDGERSVVDGWAHRRGLPTVFDRVPPT